MTKSTALLAAAVAASGCASLGAAASSDEAASLAWERVRQSRGAVVRAEQPAPAPAGLAEFCERMADVCAQTATEREPVRGEWLQTIVMRSAPLRTTPWLARGQDGASIFAQMLAERAEGVRIRHERREVALSEGLWGELNAVNLEVNRGIASSTDARSYGRDEYWAMPMTESAGGAVQGDCEDYALEKRARLIALGWDSEALALAVADAPGVGMHAVLIVQTDLGDFVLDNLHDLARSPRSLNYRWVSRQAGPLLTTWASARIDAAPARQERDELLLASHDPGTPQLEPVALLGPIVDAAS